MAEQLYPDGLDDEGLPPLPQVADSERLVVVAAVPAAQLGGRSMAQLQQAAAQQLQQHSRGYIWQCQPLQLQLAADAARAPRLPGAPPVSSAQLQAAGFAGQLLWASLSYGDNVEDAWFATALLCQLSRQLPLVLQLWDAADGQLLLIEAAEALPRWVTPTASINRAFVYGGQLHLVPLPSSPAHFGRLPLGRCTLADGLAAVVDSQLDTLAPPAVRRVIEEKLAGLPSRALSSMHHCTMCLPAAIFKILAEDPQLVAAAVNCFYLRDPLDMKVASKMKHFPAATRTLGTIKLSRCLYAQLRCQSFRPPAGFDRDMHGTLVRAGTSESKAVELGAKLACGFEILVNMAEQSHLDRHLADTGTVADDDPRWRRYLKRLTTLGYFGDNIAGSKAYQELASRAKSELARTLQQRLAMVPAPSPSAAKSSTGEDAERLEATTGADEDALQLTAVEAAAERAYAMLHRITTDFAAYRAEFDGELQDDDDSWMDLTPGDLDKLLEAYQQSVVGAEAASHDGASGHSSTEQNALQAQLASVIDNLQRFTHQESDLDGVEAPAGQQDGHEPVAVTDDELSAAMQRMFTLLAGGGQDLGGFDTDGAGHEDGTADGDEDDDDVGLDDDDDEDADEFDAAGYEANTVIARQMEEELRQSTLASSFERSEEDGAEGGVDVDLNLLKNALESLRSQQGLAGPVSTILNSMGMT